MDVKTLLAILRDKKELETLLRVAYKFEWQGYSFDYTSDFFTIKDEEGEVLWCHRDYIGKDKVVEVLLELKYGGRDVD